MFAVRVWTGVASRTPPTDTSGPHILTHVSELAAGVAVSCLPDQARVLIEPSGDEERVTCA
jgi:hypothetical protein